MRYGLVREIDGHPANAMQRLLVEEAGCDVLLEEGRPTRASLKVQRKLFFDLRAGDELLVPSLDTLQMSTGELVLLFRRFDQAGVTLRIVGEETETVPSFAGRARWLLDLLASNEGLRPDRQRVQSRIRPESKPLTRYQIDYANELRRRGASLRTIGQLFQTAPSDLKELLNSKPRQRPDIPADISLPNPPTPKRQART